MNEVDAPQVGVLPRATHGSPARPLRIGDIEIPCYVLNDGRRVLTQGGLIRSMGMKGGSGGRGGGNRLLSFAHTKAMTEFVGDEILAVLSNPIRFRAPSSGKVVYGYEATILADLCEAVLKARQQGRLDRQQIHIAERCETLVRGFARVGIIALVDEATGYQEERERDALQQLLAAYISPELLPWTETFPKEFYDEMFKLRGWTWKSTGGKRPRLVGKLTNEIVYDRLPPSVVDELRVKNPIIKNGRRKDKHHQWLTEDIGHPTLKGHLIGAIALMRAAPDWARFKRLLERAYPKPGSLRQEELELGTDDIAR